jgi:hypothetical protein
LAPECASYQTVTSLVAGEFCSPKRTIGLWLGRVFRASVPKAAIYKYGEALLYKSEVRMAKDSLMPVPTYYFISAK